MNASTKKSMILSMTALTILVMVSCSNPTGARLGSDYVLPTGIDTDISTGLIAGIPLEGDAILNNPAVVEVTDVEWVEGLSGNAMQNDADGDFIRIADSELPELTLAGSIEVWVNPNPNVAWAGILHKGQETNFSDEAWSLQYIGNKTPRFYLYSDTLSTNVTANAVLTENQWHHLAVTWTIDAADELSLKLYVDGVEHAVKTVAAFGPVKDSAGDLIIGSQLPDPYDATYGHITFQGMIDDISIYEVERSAEEVLADYQVHFPAP